MIAIDIRIADAYTQVGVVWKEVLSKIINMTFFCSYFLFGFFFVRQKNYLTHHLIPL